MDGGCHRNLIEDVLQHLMCSFMKFWKLAFVAKGDSHDEPLKNVK